MAEWLAPFRLPRFTTEDYRQAKASYVAEHGYTIHVPGFSDIIKFDLEKPMSAPEMEAWADRDWDAFSPERYAELVGQKQKRRERFERMLASPTPDLITNAASVMTSLDNAQDALTTLSVVGRIAARALPRVIGRLILGPVGWLMMAGDLLNLFQHVSPLALSCISRKRVTGALMRGNPFSMRAKLRRARRLRRGLPSLGETCEILQTTADVFGIGICLGPILGFITDAVSGTWRKLAGERVEVAWSSFEVPRHLHVANAMLRHMPLIGYFAEALSEEDYITAVLAYNFALQVVDPYLELWHPLDQIDNIAGLEIVAPAPTHVLTREVITEAGYDPDQLVGWPGSSRPWRTIDGIRLTTAPKATSNFKSWCQKRPKDWYAYLLAMGAHELVLRSYGMTETFDQLFIEESPAACFFYKAFEECWTFRTVYMDKTVADRFQSGLTVRKVLNPWELQFIKPDVRYHLWLLYSPHTAIYKDYGVFPDGWLPVDAAPPGVVIPEGTDWPPDWKPGDPLPEGVTIPWRQAHPNMRVITTKWAMDMYMEALEYFLAKRPPFNICDVPVDLGIQNRDGWAFPLMQR